MSTVYFCWSCDVQVSDLSLARADEDGGLHHFCSARHQQDFLERRNL
jgi:hypothetical protein